MAVNVKMGVDLGGFTAGIKQGQQILKGLNAEMKASEAEFKATGNAEQKMTSQTKTLNSQLNIQKNIAQQAKTALQAMTDAGVDPASAAYQKMYIQMMNAEAGANEAQAALNALNGTTQEAAAGADKLTGSLNGISKKLSLDQVISGIGKITGALEGAAKKAAQLGETIWNGILSSAQWSDDTATQAMLLDMSVEKYQQYKGVFDTIAELSVSDWTKAKRKVEKAITDPSKDQIDVMQALGFMHYAAGKTEPVLVNDLAGNWEEVFWQASQKLKQKVDSGELTLEQADMFGEAFFGKSFSQLKPLIDLGEEGFKAALDTQNVASEEAIKKNAELNDAVIKLQNSYTALQAEVTSGLAPALTKAAEVLDNLLGKVLEYLQTEEGQKMLEDMGTAITDLFSGLSDISAEDVVTTFKEAFGAVTDTLKWIVDNKDDVVTAIEAIFGIWGTLKVSSGVLTILKVINGLKDLAGIGGGAAAGGGIMTTVESLLTTASGKVNELIGGGLGDFLLPFGDWFTHEGPLGPVFQGVESIGDWIARQKSEFDDRLASFGEDWANNELIKFWTRRDANQDAADRLPQGADWRPSYMRDMEPIPVETVPEAPADAAQQIQEQVGPVTIPVTLDPSKNWLPSYMRGFANGTWSVPYDGMLARLHKGERVMPAREVSSRSYSSNLYVESMIMNNGTDAAGLAAAMAAAQRRTMSGYGS